MSKFINFFRIKKNIAIDLGTSNVLIYDKQKKKIVLNEPSVIVKDKKTGYVVATGIEARQMVGKNPDSLEVIKPLKDGVISNIDATRQMLYEFIKKIYGVSLFKPEIMICVPIEVTTVEKRALFDAVTVAKKIYLIEEGRAAIIGAGIDISKPTGNMVIDIGGGSTDVAVLSLDEIVASKSLRIAGNSFDNDIIQYVKDNIGLYIGDRTAEKIKKELATAIKLSDKDNMTMIIKGRNMTNGIPEESTITSNQVQEAIINSIMQIIDATKEVLSKCPPEISSDILENGIVLTGGGALIKNFDKLIEKEIKISVNIPENPLETVVIGGVEAFNKKKLLSTLLTKEL